MKEKKANDNIDNESKNIVKEICEELKISQNELAKLLGVHLTTVQKWASSNKIPQMAMNYINLYKENEKNKKIIQLLKELQKLLNT